jgi:ketosteroid isomerase-like protein
MTVTAEYVREIFGGLEEGDGASFFGHVDDKVDWIVEGTHPLAGHYRSKAAFIEGTFAKLSKVLPRGAQLHVENVLLSGDAAVVELHSLATAKNGLRFDNRYCWIVYCKHARKAAATLLSRGTAASIMLPGQRRDEARWIASSMVTIRRAFAAADWRCEPAHRQAKPVDQRR